MLDVERERERERKRHLSWPACFRLSFRTSTIASPILPCSTTLVRARLAVLPSTFRLPASGAPFTTFQPLGRSFGPPNPPDIFLSDLQPIVSAPRSPACFNVLSSYSLYPRTSANALANAATERLTRRNARSGVERELTSSRRTGC
jgi:hypothetical protein